MRLRHASSRPSSLVARNTVCNFVASCLVSLTWLALVSSPRADAVTFSPAPQPNLDLSQLGRVAVAGNFDSISLFEFEGQGDTGFNSNGSQSLLQQYPTGPGAFATLSSSDGHIHGLCPFQLENDTLLGVVVGGNFTSLGGVEAQGIALWDPESGDITPVPGLNGQVNAVYCDQDTNTVYIGGSFTGANSSNAIAYTPDGFSNLPFAGFNGPVSTITKAPSGSIVFGGEFDGLGNATSPAQPDMQVVPVTSANVTASPSSGMDGFSDPRNIICKTADEGGPGNEWLLADNVAGFWNARFAFGFVPTKLRLYNTNQDDRGTRTWRFTALPIDGIMRFTYIDSNGRNRTCDSECPLPENNQTAQDFHFVNNVGMNEFRIDISDWYGDGGGLAGIELFQDDIFAYAINDFNEPACDNVSPGTATATVDGPWMVTPSGESTSQYLSATLSGNSIDPAEASVVFQPNIRQSGNYSITVYTPGCLQSNTCSERGRVNITGLSGLTSDSSVAEQPYSTIIAQTNNYDKYDQIYLGFVDSTSDSFMPSVTLAPAAGQDGPLNIVAQRVRFEIMSTSGGLNGLFEFDPEETTVSTDFSESAIDSAGNELSDFANVRALVTQGDSLIVGGDFTSEDFDNIFSVSNGQPSSLPGGGLNGQVMTMYETDDLVYVGGEFTSTRDNSGAGLSGVAVFDNSSNAWRGLGSGVNGSVTNIVPLQLNLGGDDPEPVIAVSGFFDSVFSAGGNTSFEADNIALWDPSRMNWLNNLDLPGISISGILSATTDVPGFDPVFAGNIASAGLGAGDAVALTGSGDDLSLQQLPIRIMSSDEASNSNSSALAKRAVIPSNGSIEGATTAKIYEENGINITAIGGHFTLRATNGTMINNLLIINGSDNEAVTGFGSGIDASSTVLAVEAGGNTLFVGGDITGSVNGGNVSALVFYDLVAAAYSRTQPPELTAESGTVTVNAIASNPSATNDVFVGGSFDTAGDSFNCPSLCIWDTARAQWNSPGSGIGGTVNDMKWIDNDRLLIGGNLTVNGTSQPLTLYNREGGSFSAIPSSDDLPGPVTSVCNAASDGNSYWVAGVDSSNGQSYIQKFDGERWTAISGLAQASTVQSIQQFQLADDHDDTDLLENDQALMVLGNLGIDDFGNASAALFNGTTFTPFLLTTLDGGQGLVSQIIVQHPENLFKSGGGNLAVGFVVLIGLAIALVLIFLLVVAGILAERIRRRREGYSRAPSQPIFERSNMSRLPPHELFQSLRRGDNGGML